MVPPEMPGTASAAPMPAPLRKMLTCRFNESLLAIAAQNAPVRAAAPHIDYPYDAPVSAIAFLVLRPAAKSSPLPPPAAIAIPPAAHGHKQSAESHRTVRPPASHGHHPPGVD